MDTLEAKLTEVFGYQSFRPGQREVIERLLQGRHTFAAFPTGAGKSLCYQLTAQLLPGITVVVSPLIALMEDQIVEQQLDRTGAYGQLRSYGGRQIATWIDDLIGQGLLLITAEEYPRQRLTPAGRQALESPTLIALTGFAEPAATPVATSAQGRDDDSLEVQQEQAVHAELYERLRKWRAEKARGLALPAYGVLHNSGLTEIARRLPSALSKLGGLRGIGARKIEQFGQEIIDLVQSCPRSPQPPSSADISAGHENGQAPPSDSALKQAPTLSASADLRLQIELFRQGGPEPDCGALLRAIENGEMRSSHEVAWAIHTLAALGERRAIPILIKLIDSRDGTMQMYAAEALGQLGAREAIPRLLALLEGPRPGTRRAAIRALGRMRAREALDRCRRMVAEEESEAVRLAAQAAVMLIKEEE